MGVGQTYTLCKSKLYFICKPIIILANRFLYSFSELGSFTYTFSEKIRETSVTFYIIKMKNCIFVWIGDSPVFENLAVAMNIKYSSMPVSSSIMGQSSDDNSGSLAARLSKKIGKQVFASFNLSNPDNNVLLAVSKRLMEEVTKHPEKF